VVSAIGEVLATCGPDEEVLTAKLTRADLDAASDTFPVLRDRRPELYAQLTAPMSRFGRWTSEPR
jgi:predicted amidohydrolase